MRRIVITGAGLITPLGSNPGILFQALLDGKSAVRAFPEWTKIEDLRCLVAAPVTGFSPKSIPRKHRRTMGTVAQYAVAAANIAVSEAGLTPELLTSGRVGVVAGSTMGSPSSDGAFWAHYHTKASTRGLKGTHFFQVMSHTCSTNIAMHLGITGESLATNAACASSTQAIGVALDRIRAGRADVILAGGADELHPAAVVTFDTIGGATVGYNDNPTETPRPFDSARDGIVIGEGAGILVLEEREHALARGATILAEVLGYGGTSDAVNMASPSPDGMAQAIRLALLDAGIQPPDIDYINAHATGTPVGDAAEASALFEIFGSNTPVSSIKGCLGHTMGACGAIEARICAEAMLKGVIPPNTNLVDPSVAPIELPTKPLERELSIVLTVNFAFGGVNTALVLKKP